MRSRLVVPLLVLLSLVSVGAAVAPSLRKPDAVPVGAEPITPVFSVRRVPGAVSRTIAAERLRGDIDGLVAARPDTCLAVRDPDGRPIYARLMTKPLIPASNMKLLTSAVVLDKLGADTRYVTPVKASGPPQDGAVGDLWLVGSGDPLLATSDYASVSGWLETPKPATSLEALADRVAGAGVRRVGRVMGDESRYDRVRYIPSWAAHYSINDVGPQSALTVNSGYVQWRPQHVASTAPATHAATVFADLLRARGVTVGGVGEGRAPDPGVTLAQIESPPMAEVVGAMMTHSDNLAAELLVKELGVRSGGGGTTSAGLSVVRDWGAGLGELAAADGSGLDRGGRMTCGLIDEVLRRSGDDGPLANGLPMAGTRGTLLRRFTTTPAAGKVRAKTGSLAGVVALSGFATDTRGESLQFAMLANDIPSEPAGMALQDRLVTVLAGYPMAPVPDDIGPAPVRS